MNSVRFFLALVILTMVSVVMTFAQAVGDYGSVTSGNWNDVTTWGTWDGSGWTGVPAAPPAATDNVWIVGSFTVEVTTSPNTCNNLNVASGKLYANLALPTSSIRYIRISNGGVVTVTGGMLGDTVGVGDVLSLEAMGSMTITGSGGIVSLGRIRTSGTATSFSITLDRDLDLNYNGSSGTGGMALYTSNVSGSTCIITLNAGKTLTLNDGAYVGTGSSTAADGTASTTYNIDGTVNMTANGRMSLNVGTALTSTLNVGGVLNVGQQFVVASSSAVVPTIAVNASGIINLGTGGSGAVTFGSPTQAITGPGTFNLLSGATISISSPDGISLSGASGHIQTATRNFSSGAIYAYAGTASQVTGTGLPSSPTGLTINNVAGVTLTNSATVTGTLTFTLGNLITGANTITIGPAGTVSRTSGHVVGRLQKNVATGAAVSRSFEIGTGADYTPIDVTFASVTTTGTLTATTTAGDHPNIASSTIDPTKSVNRYWTITNGGVGFDAYDATFNFVGTDVDAGANPSVFIAEKYSAGSWSGLVEGARTSTSTQITGVTSFSDFAIGEALGTPPAPGFELSVSNLDFGSVTLGNAVIDTFFIRNIGTATLHVTSIVSNNTPEFIVAPGSATVPAGDSVLATVRFAPTAAGPASATITFTDDALGSPHTLQASGTGLAVGTTILSNGTGGGDWSLSSTWQGGIVPTGIDSAVVRGTDSVYVSVDVACAGLSGGSTAKLALYDTLTVGNATLRGLVVVQANGRLTVSGTATFENGSTYQHARDGGTIPTAAWNAGSTCSMTGITGGVPGNSNQNFYHFIWNCPGQTANLNTAWSGNTIGGNITCINSAGSRFQFTNNTAYAAPITINGDVIVIGGGLTPTGSSGAASYVVNTLGNVIVTGGNLGVSRGSGGIVTWNLFGNVSISNATLQTSNTASKYVFAGSGTHTVALSNVTYTSQNNFEVSGSSTVDMGTSVLRGSGSFTMNPGATLRSGHPGGLDSTLSNTGAKALGSGSNFVFNGTSLQNTGRVLADTLNNLTISNSSGVVLSDSIVVNGTVSLTSGDLDLNGKKITLGPSGVLSETTGNTLVGTSGVVSTTRTLTAPSVSTDIAGLGIMIGSSADLGSTVLTRGPAIQSGAGSGSIKRYADITPTTNTGLNATLVFKYDDSELNAIPETNLLLFKSTDNGTSWVNAGGTVNTSANTITLSGVNDLSRWTAAATGPAITCVPVPHFGGWNLVSLPVRDPIPNDSVRSLFPTSFFAYVFEFVPGSGYVQRYRMAFGKGYWAKFPAIGTDTICGTAVTRDSISVVAGWNMVGAITNPVDTSTITSLPPGLRSSNWFGYSTGYSTVTQLLPGKGYWVKANGAGLFILANPPLSGLTKGGTSTGLSVDALNSLTITDNKGASQTLYFGADAKDEIQLAQFEMPPAPPEGAFDARFESPDGGMMVRTHASRVETMIDFPVRIQSLDYPVTVSWNVRSSDATYELGDAVGQSIGSRLIAGDGSITVRNNAVKQIILKVVGAGIPTSYALYQNYPNPFNPSTTIKFDLPVDSRVTVEVYNVLGQRVRTLINENRRAGYEAIEWNGTGDSGQQLSSGVYFLRIDATGVNGKTFADVRKLMMLK